MVTIYTPCDFAATAKNATEITVTMEEANEKNAILDATFINMRRTLRDELSDASSSEWIVENKLEEDNR